MNESGVATIVIVIAVVAGATATPVVADSVDVPPDHPLYGLERAGEAIKYAFSLDKDAFNADRACERAQEALQMAEKGKHEL
ncbi:MAG: hypothetical protein JRE40_13400, partial [Deltaproteobacteria bacterium]|nr:hypothetical protein [Deltaproteobacteria bacterium]